MPVRVTESADEFAARAGGFLASRIEHNILATVLEGVLARPAGARALFAYAEDHDGHVRAATLRTWPRRMLASTMDATAAAALMEAWLARDPELPGVGAPREVARSLARAWEERTGGAVTVAMSLALHTLEHVLDPERRSPGRLRAAGEDDRSLLIGWMFDFAAEVGVENAPDAAEAVARRIDRGLMHVWDDGRPVSMVGSSPEVAGVVRIGPVFTPPARRGRGYASSAVAATSRAALEAGARKCALYTDLANPTSNRIYAALGYSRIVDWEDLAFARAAGTANNLAPS